MYSFLRSSMSFQDWVHCSVITKSAYVYSLRVLCLGSNDSSSAAPRPHHEPDLIEKFEMSITSHRGWE